MKRPGRYPQEKSPQAESDLEPARYMRALGQGQARSWVYRQIDQSGNRSLDQRIQMAWRAFPIRSNTTAAELCRFITQEKDNGTPISVLTGAGVSRSAGIPVASELLTEVRDSNRYQANIAGLSEKQLGDYGTVMSALDYSERKALLGPYLSKAGVNWGQLALASMMEAGFVGRVGVVAEVSGKRDSHGET